MPEEKPKAPAAETKPKAPDAEAKQMTAADAAKRVKRKADDVLSFRDYGTHVVVVTCDGQKLTDAE